jgi:hypothetical protein
MSLPRLRSGGGGEMLMETLKTIGAIAGLIAALLSIAINFYQFRQNLSPTPKYGFLNAIERPIFVAHGRSKTRQWRSPVPRSRPGRIFS